MISVSKSSSCFRKKKEKVVEYGCKMISCYFLNGWNNKCLQKRWVDLMISKAFQFPFRNEVGNNTNDTFCSNHLSSEFHFGIST